MYEHEQEQVNRLSPKLIARAWGDEEFKKRLIEDPRKVLAEDYGLELPEDFPLNIVASDEPAGQQVEMTSEPLAAAAGAGTPPLIIPMVVVIAAAPSGVGGQSLGPSLAGSTSGTAGTSGSLGTVCGTAASIFTVGSAGTAGAAPGATAPPLITYMTIGQSQGAQTAPPSAASSPPLAVFVTPCTASPAPQQGGGSQQLSQAGSTVGSAATVGSVLCICGSLGTIASGGTVGTAG